MAFPTRHWSRITANLTAGAFAPVAHGLVAGGRSLTPDAILSDNLRWGVSNVSIASYATPDATNVYLSNYDSTAAHWYDMVIRSYHSIDDQNY